MRHSNDHTHLSLPIEKDWGVVESPASWPPLQYDIHFPSRHDYRRDQLSEYFLESTAMLFSWERNAIQIYWAIHVQIGFALDRFVQLWAYSPQESVSYSPWANSECISD